MTAEGELMINEDLRDLISNKKEMKVFKSWELDGSDYAGVWNRKDMKGHHKIKIVDSETDKILGLVEVDVETFIKDCSFWFNGYEEFIDTELVEKSINIIDLGECK